MQYDLEVLFRDYRDELQRLAHHRLRDLDAAADVVQDAFLRFARATEDGNDCVVENPRLFLWRIVSNLTLDISRHTRRWGEPSNIDDIAEYLADLRPAPDRSMELQEKVALLRSALESLAPKCRKALVLSRIEGLSHTEVAERLDVSVSMVSKYIMQALKHCARCVRFEYQS